jgi:hypothetical protein
MNKAPFEFRSVHLQTRFCGPCGIWIFPVPHFFVVMVVLSVSGTEFLAAGWDDFNDRLLIRISPSKEAPSDMDSLGVVICPSIRAV